MWTSQLPVQSFSTLNFRWSWLVSLTLQISVFFYFLTFEKADYSIFALSVGWLTYLMLLHPMSQTEVFDYFFDVFFCLHLYFHFSWFTIVHFGTAWCFKNLMSLMCWTIVWSILQLVITFRSSHFFICCMYVFSVRAILYFWISFCSYGYIGKQCIWIDLSVTKHSAASDCCDFCTFCFAL